MGKKQETKDTVVLIRMGKSLRAALKKEADADSRSVAAYIRHMLETDPRRLKEKK